MHVVVDGCSVTIDNGREAWPEQRERPGNYINSFEGRQTCSFIIFEVIIP